MTGSVRTFAAIDDSGRYLTSDGMPSHFSTLELRCKCGCGARQADQALIDMLERLRRLVGEPVSITSGVRCWPYHVEVYTRSGTPIEQIPRESQHVPRDVHGNRMLERGTNLGATRASDITIRSLSPKHLRHLLEQNAAKLGIVGMGAYPGFTHVDARSGQRARW